jgi:hypothetical protein
MQSAHIVYKTLGFKWLHEVLCPASAFVSADRYEARNPQRFIHATVGNKCKKTDDQTDTIVINNNERKDLAF